MRPRAMHCPPTPPRTTRRPSVHQVMRRPKRGRTLSATGPPKHTQPHHPRDGSLATLSERCMVARDVFYVDSIDHPWNDVIPNPTLTSTNLNTTWTAQADALSFGAGAAMPIGTVGPANVTVTTVPGIPVVVGNTYAEPLNHSVPRPYLDLLVGGIELTTDGATSGSFRVDSLAED